MKLELKENMYVRTKDGHVDKIIKINNDSLNGRIIQVKNGELDYCMGYTDFTDLFPSSHYTKASFNIIDILEVGDVIKLFMEDDIDEEDTNIFELIAINYNDNEIGVFNSDFQIEFFPIENLRGVLTHEQMEQIAYKVGE